MAEYLETDPEVVSVENYVKSMFGWPVVNVELSGNHYTHAFNTAIEEYSNYITQWAIKAHIANALGLPSAQDFTLRWVSQNFEFAKSFAESYSEQANVGGETPIRKTYFSLEEGKQVYYLPDDIEISEVMWQAPPAINRYLIDPNNNANWTNQEFGWAFMGSSMKYVTPVSFTIQLAQHTDMRYKTLRGDYSYIIRPAPEDGTRTGNDYTGQTKNAIYMHPTPTGSQAGFQVWYFYKNLDDLNAYSAQTSGSVVSNPGTIDMSEIPYTDFNSPSKRWVKQYTLAICKEIMGRIRSKFSTLPIPDSEITLDGDQLISEAREEKDQLREYILNELEQMDVNKMMADSAEFADNLESSLSHNPMGITRF
jgi:hypothetical protein